MNAVEIEEAVAALAEKPFDAAEFAWEFLAAFDNSDTTIKRLRKGETNKSDVGGVLQSNNIHLKVCKAGEVLATLHELRESAATRKAKAKFILATDGEELQAENLLSGEHLVSKYVDFADHFGFFLPLAGISTVKEIAESSFDIKATGRLNRLYLELRRSNPAWNKRASDMNHFMARLIFCFFAEDTDIFGKPALFTSTLEQMSSADNAHDILEEIFRALNTRAADRDRQKCARWTRDFPYVNGGLFSGSVEVPKFTKTARSYLLNIGKLDWKRINPDIFGSMIQAVADDEERGSLGMHYTSVPNILKLLNPLFLDALNKQLEEAGESKLKLLNLRKRLARVRVFDPACGSGNFLVIAYKHLRELEAKVNERRGEKYLKSEIPLTNFRGIELREFPAEIARLALIIAEFQCDELYLGQKEALAKVLPLANENWITCGDALRIDWLATFPRADRPGTNDAPEWETYVCGNPPYVGDKKQSTEQKATMESTFSAMTTRWKSFDYVCAFVFKAADFVARSKNTNSALVTTNSISQGLQVAQIWPLVLARATISFAVTAFKWSNLASRKAGVTCVIIGLGPRGSTPRPCLIDGDQKQLCDEITPYLTSGKPVYIEAARGPLSDIPEMLLGNFAKDGGHLLLTQEDNRKVEPGVRQFVRPIFGGKEFISGKQRYCLWISDEQAATAAQIPFIADRLAGVAANRASSPKKATAAWSKRPHRFVEIRSPDYRAAIIMPRTSSEEREWLPVGLLPPRSIITEGFGLYDAPLWNLALIASRLHLIWIATVCGKMKTDFRYSNTLGWNTFPVPKLTENNKADLTHAAERILLARESHFPATIADLYEPDAMPQNLKEAHEHNDELIERIYIGRRFKNDTERLEKLFDMYTKLTTGPSTAKPAKKAPARKKA